VGFGNPLPIESVEGKPVFGFVIAPDRFNELIEEIRKEFGNDFIVAKKLKNDKLRVTFILTAKEPGNKTKIAGKLDRIADGMNIQRIAAAEMNPNEVSFSFGKKTPGTVNPVKKLH
jgi:hypothetical protein